MAYILLGFLLFISFIFINNELKKGKDFNNFLERETYKTPITVERKSILKKDLEEFLLFENSKAEIGHFMIFDIETTGLIKKKNANPADEPEKFPFIVQLSWLLFDANKKLIFEKNYIIKQKKNIPINAIAIHGITTEIANEKGKDIKDVLIEFTSDISNSKILISHNMEFDYNTIVAELTRNELQENKVPVNLFCTMDFGTDFCKIEFYNKDGFKYPTLKELFHRCFFPEVRYLNLPNIFHNSNVDAKITATCFFKMLDDHYLTKYTIYGK